MRIFILAIGTRGDVENFLILGRELRRRGHRVLMGSSAFYADSIRAAELDWVQIGGGTAGQMEQVLQAMSAIEDSRKQTETFIRQWVAPQLTQSIATIRSYALNADYFISNMKMAIRRKDHAVPGAFVTYDVPESLDDLTRHQTQRYGGRIIDLVSMNKRLIDAQNQWPSTCQFTGFWSEPQPATWLAPQDLGDFLSAGPPPVVVTIGSMASDGQSGLTDRIIDALNAADTRGIILGNLAGSKRGALPGDRVYFGGEIPYHWLFPRACAVVHHGGAGTAAAAISAGLPSVVLPQISAQQFLARVLSEAGLATAILQTRPLDVTRLAEAIHTAATDPKHQQIARQWQAEIATDRGVLLAADLIEAHAKQLA
jgi:sterol 3beta-glucosyltransferase